jgi:hypothetical protein
MSNRVLRSALRYNEERQRAQSAARAAESNVNPNEPTDDIDNAQAEEGLAIADADPGEANPLPANAAVLFPNHYVLFENDDFRLIIKKSAFKKQKRFTLRCVN